jgi:hypothetical protein
MFSPEAKVTAVSKWDVTAGGNYGSASMSGRKSESFSPTRFIKDLASEPDFATYGLRSQFFARKLRELGFLTVAEEVEKLPDLADSFPWAEAGKIGIDPDMFEAIRAQGLEPLLFFVHPRVIEEQPSLLMYYRCLAMLPHKGLRRIMPCNIAALESGSATTLTRDRAVQLAIVLNRLLSRIAQSFLDVQPLRKSDLRAFVLAQAGSQIQGSWNNAIGEQGELAVKEILLRHLQEEIRQVVWKDDTSLNLTKGVSAAQIFARLAEVKVLRLNAGYHCVFGTEPDISLRNAQDIPLISVEVKAGSDPGGALERYGAAKKSFDHEDGLNPRLKRIYVAASITEEVDRRLKHENPFSHTFLLSDLLADEGTQKRFGNLFVREIIPPNR